VPKFLWACWDGGGNLPPSLGIARALTDRGHSVGFFGRPDMVGRVEASGFRATQLGSAYAALERYGANPLPTVFGYTSSGLVGQELVEVVATESPDVVVVDAMFTAALADAPRFGRPTAVMLHTFLNHCLAMWRGNFAMQSESRERAGFAPLPSLDALWGERELLHVNALSEFDRASPAPWSNVRYGAPVLGALTGAHPVSLPWTSDDDRPLVVVSFSTVREQRSPEMLQRALDALAARPVRVVASLGGIVGRHELDVPANAHVVEFVDHDALLGDADVVVGHGGHGTTMRSLRAGVPIVCIPAKGGDQPVIAGLIERWGVGCAMPQDASAAAIGAAVDGVLADASARAAARDRAAAFSGPDGAELAADALERLADAARAGSRRAA